MNDQHLARRVMERLNNPTAPRNFGSMPDDTWGRLKRQFERQMRQAETAFNALFEQSGQNAADCLSAYMPTIGDDPFLLSLGIDGATVAAVRNRLHDDVTAYDAALEVIKYRWLSLHPSVVAVGNVERKRACEIAAYAVMEITAAQRLISDQGQINADDQ